MFSRCAAAGRFSPSSSRRFTLNKRILACSARKRRVILQKVHRSFLCGGFGCFRPSICLGNVQHEVKQCQYLQFVGKYILSCSAEENLYYDHNYSRAVLFPLQLAYRNHCHSFMNTKDCLNCFPDHYCDIWVINGCQSKTCAFVLTMQVNQRNPSLNIRTEE